MNKKEIEEKGKKQIIRVYLFAFFVTGFVILFLKYLEFLVIKL